MLPLKNQDQILTDGDKPWKAKKDKANLLGTLYLTMGDERKGYRLLNCATQLGFIVLPDGGKKLCEANFCRVRLCPMCAWRRSLKVYGQVRACCEHDSMSKFRYIFLTLTCRSCSGDELPSTLDAMLSAWRRLTLMPAPRAAWCGTLRSLEVTARLNDDGDATQYHPHIHALIAVKPSYFKGGKYISQAAYRELWRAALRCEYDPVVHVERCHGDAASIVAESTKYATKDTDYLLPEDWEMSAERVRELDRAFYKRRFVAFGGAFADARKALQLDDIETGDLVRADGSECVDDETAPRVYYSWLSCYNQYYAR